MQPPWDDTFALAWASYIDGTIPVGAMLLDGDGRRVAVGLNRRYSSDPVAGQLSGSRLAHAELNALAGVDPMTNVRDHTLYTTLEPCSLCVGASIQAGIGTVVYAAPDPYGGAASMRLDNRQVQLRRPEFVVEPDLRWRDLGVLLVLVFAIEVRRHDSIVDAYRDRLPDLVKRAEDDGTRATIQDAAAANAPWSEVRNALAP